MAKTKNRGYLIKILCVLMGAVFAFSIAAVYGSWSWKKSSNSGYATGSYLPNHSYQIINDSLPNGIPFGDGAKDYELAIEYSYDYDFKLAFKYELNWSSTAVDESNVILQYADRDAWIVDDNYMYYTKTIPAGTGKLPILVGVAFANCEDEAYLGLSLKIAVSEVEIVRNSNLFKENNSSKAYQIYNKYVQYTASSYTGTGAFVAVYDPTTIGDYQPKMPVGKTAFKSSAGNYKKIWGNKIYVGMGIYVITGASSISIKAKVTGAWMGANGAAAVNVVANTIKYNFSEHWSSENYDDGGMETREFDYTIPAHTAVYIDVIDSVEMVSRGYTASTDDSGVDPYESAHISTQLALNGGENITTTNGIGTTTISSAGLTGKIAMPSSDYRLFNSSKYQAALYQIADSANSVTPSYQTQIKFINNSNKRLKVTTSSYALKLYVSNGNTAPEIVPTALVTDNSNWARAELSSNAVGTVKSIETIVVEPYSAVTLCSEFSIATTVMTATYSALGNATILSTGCDIWAVLIPTISVSTVAESDTTTSNSLLIQTEVSGMDANIYLKNISNKTYSAATLTVDYKYLSYSPTSLSSEPASWGTTYWKYYTKSGSTYTQISKFATFNSSAAYYSRSWVTGTSISNLSKTNITICPGEKVLFGSASLTAGVQYWFSNVISSGYAVTSRTEATNVSDVQLVNEDTSSTTNHNELGSAYLINNSATTSYYVRIVSTSNMYNFPAMYNNGAQFYLLGLIRPGQVIPVDILNYAATSTIEVIPDLTGYLISSNGFVAKGWSAEFYNKMAAMYASANS